MPQVYSDYAPNPFDGSLAPALVESRARTMFNLLEDQRRSVVTLASLPDWSTVGPTLSYSFDIIKGASDRYTLSIDWRNTLPADIYNTAKWAYFYVDPVSGNDANAGTKASPLKDLYNAVNSTTLGNATITGMTVGTSPVVTEASAHGLLVNEWVYIPNATVGIVIAAGWYKISAVTTLTYTLGTNSTGGAVTSTGVTFTSGTRVKPRRLLLKKGSTFWYGASGTGLCWNGATQKCHMVITPDDGLDGYEFVTSTMQVKPSFFSWTIESGTTWQTSNTLTTNYVYNKAQLDSTGLQGVKYTNAADLASCRATPRSWVLISNVLYVNTGNTIDPSNFLEVTRASVDGQHNDSPANLFMSRVKFERGDRCFYVAPFATTTYRPIMSIDQCEFNKSTGSDGWHCEGNVELYCFSCKASLNESDGFNDRATTGTSFIGVYTQCDGHYNGCLTPAFGDSRTSASYGTNQGFTCHINSKLLRVGCRASYNGGQGFFETATTASTSCQSWCVGCFEWNQRGSNDNVTYTSTKYNCGYGIGSVAGATAEVLRLIDCYSSNPETGEASTTTYPITIQQFSGAQCYDTRSLAYIIASQLKLTGSAVSANYIIY